MRKTLSFQKKTNMRIPVKKILLYLEYTLSTIAEAIFIYYIPNNYLREVIILDIIYSFFYHLQSCLFFLLQFINCTCFITLLFLDSLRVYSLFWLYIIFKNQCRIFILRKTQEKKDALLKDIDDIENIEDPRETATIISV